MSTTIRKNSEVIKQSPSDWFPELRSKLDALGEHKDDVLLAFNRLREDTQRLDAQVKQMQGQVQVGQAAPAPVLNTFVELNVGSPAGPDGALRIRFGRGTPEGAVQGSAFKDVFFRVDAAGITTFMYVKTTGEGLTGWTACAL